MPTTALMAAPCSFDVSRVPHSMECRTCSTHSLTIWTRPLEVSMLCETLPEIVVVYHSRAYWPTTIDSMTKCCGYRALEAMNLNCSVSSFAATISKRIVAHRTSLRSVVVAMSGSMAGVNRSSYRAMTIWAYHRSPGRTLSTSFDRGCSTRSVFAAKGHTNTRRRTFEALLPTKR